MTQKRESPGRATDRSGADRGAFPPFVLLIFSLVFGGVFLGDLPAGLAAGEGMPAWTADVLLRESGRQARICGAVAVSEQGARLDMDLGDPGVFRAVIDRGGKALYVMTARPGAFVKIALNGDESNIRDLALAVARAAMPFGSPALTLREEERRELGSGWWEGHPARRSRSRFVAEYMGKMSAWELDVWENEEFAPFPLRLVNPNGNGDSVELINIRSVGNDERTDTQNSSGPFSVPDDYARYGSVLELLLFSLAAR